MVLISTEESKDIDVLLCFVYAIQKIAQLSNEFFVNRCI